MVRLDQIDRGFDFSKATCFSLHKLAKCIKLYCDCSKALRISTLTLEANTCILIDSWHT